MSTYVMTTCHIMSCHDIMSHHVMSPHHVMACRVSCAQAPGAGRFEQTKRRAEMAKSQTKQRSCRANGCNDSDLWDVGQGGGKGAGLMMGNTQKDILGNTQTPQKGHFIAMGNTNNYHPLKPHKAVPTRAMHPWIGSV